MKVASLFAGCGGLDLGFEQAGFEIVYAMDFDKFAVQTYNENFSHKAELQDIFELNPKDMPDFDVLIGGFPCQPFSIMGSLEGFEDEKRGNAFFRIMDIVREKEPTYIVLENVKNLLLHDEGNTFKVIQSLLSQENYYIEFKVLNTRDHGLPQTRNRIFIVASKMELDYQFPEKEDLHLTMQDLLQDDVSDKYFLSEKMVKTVMSWGTKGYSAKPETDLKVARPLTATMAKMHRASQDNYVTESRGLRRLTPRECARLQGFPDSFIIPVSDSQAYKQFGNAVSVNVSFKVATALLEAIKKKEE